ncbi:MAG: efflux RND transporter periplasmic adaptor subunit [Humidesulfovibrio sp.]
MQIRKRFASLLVFAALAALLSGCGQSTQAGGPPKQGEPEVTVVDIAPEQITLTTVLAGRTSAYLVADVRPQVNGIVQQRLFREGAEVKAGELLYQIDPATYQAAYNNAKAALAKAEANALPARLKAERFAGLAKVRAVSQQDNDDAQAAHHQAEAEVVAARAALDSARINLSYTRVSAPIAGRIGKSTVTPGALVTASQPAALATIQQTDPIYVDVTQSSSEVMRLKRDLASGRLKKAGANGAKVKLLLEDGSAYPAEGALQFSDITVDQSTGVVTVRAVFPNPNHDLLPGLYVRAVLEEGVQDQAILVPQAAVSRDSKGNPLVLTVKPDGVVEPRPIEVGRPVGDKWLVLSGLAGGERVIVEGLQKARPGAKVKAVLAAASGAAQPGAKAEAKPEAAKPEAPKAEASPAAQPAAAATPAKAAKPQPAKAAKPAQDQDAQTDMQKDTPDAPKKSAQAKDTARKKEPLVYSPPRDQPWPGSTGPAGSGQTSESKPAQS